MVLIHRIAKRVNVYMWPIDNRGDRFQNPYIIIGDVMNHPLAHYSLYNGLPMAGYQQKDMVNEAVKAFIADHYDELLFNWNVCCNSDNTTDGDIDSAVIKFHV